MKTKTSQAKAAACVRAELKKAFPNTKFSVTSDSGANTSSVDIRWANGPTCEQVKAYSKKYQYGHFDGMVDMYEYSNTNADIPQAKFVFAQRELTEDIKLQIAQLVADDFGLTKPDTVEELGDNVPYETFHNWYNWHQIAWQALNKVSLVGCTKIVKDPAWEGGSIFSGYQGAGQ
jgi:hypothetical protein